MIKKVILVCIVAVIAVGAVAIGRYPRRHVTANSFPIQSADADKPLTLTDLKADELIPAAVAPVAPQLTDGTWINSDPLPLEKLRGRVVLIEFWTFACYNCRNTLPSVKDWSKKYRERGLTIVGVHTPELREEYNLDNVRREVPSLGITYPVVTDNDYKTWKAYNVEAWPTIFMLDKQGRIRWLHVGEGFYDQTESVIKTLLAE